MNDFSKDQMVQEQLKQYDYIALRLGEDDLVKQHDAAGSTSKNGDVFAHVQQMGIEPIQVFTNKRGDRVMIFKRRSTLSQGTA